MELYIENHKTVQNTYVVWWSDFLFYLEILTVCSCHVTCPFQSESTLYSCQNVNQLFARSRCEIWSLSDCNLTRTQNHLVRKRTLNHLVKLESHTQFCSQKSHTQFCSQTSDFVYELSGSGFESSCSHLNSR